MVDGGPSGGNTVIVLGNFATTSLDYSTITIIGSTASDTVDITGLTSDHRVVFASNGGADTVVGTPRPQDVFRLQAFGPGLFGMGDGLEALTGVRDPGGRGLAPELGWLTADDGLDALVLQAMLEALGHALGSTLIETPLDQHPLEMTADTAPLQHTQNAFGIHLVTMRDRRIAPAEVDYMLG